MLVLLPLLFQTSPVPPMPQLPACSFDRPAMLVERKADLPADVIAELERLFRRGKGIAEANSFFETSDAPITDAPQTRFLRAYQLDDHWIIWFEPGGAVPTMLVLAPSRGDDGKIGLYAQPGSHFMGDLCVASHAYLMGVRSAG